MKKILLSILLFTCCLQAGAQWSLNYIGAITLNSVVIPSQYNALVLGGQLSSDSLELVYNSYDMGRTWNYSWYSPRAWVTGVSFPNEQTGYWCTDSGVVIKTVNGGFTWDTLSHAPGNAGGRNLNSVYFLNADTGFAAGGNQSDDSIQTIIKTIDGGNSWIVQLDTFGYWLKSIYFMNADTGFAIGDQGVLLKTVDGGNTWNTVTLAGDLATRQFNQVYFIKNTDTGFIVGGDDSSQTILISSDAGNTWNAIMDTPGSMFNSISFATASQGYIVGNGGVVYISNNGGATWSFDSIPYSLGEGLNLNSVYFYNSHYGIAGGDNGKLLLFLDTTYYLNAYDSTLLPSGIDYTSLPVNGKVDPNGKATHVWFEYGTSILLGDTISATIGTLNGNGWQADSVTINGLTPGTQYFYRVVSSDGVDTGYGATLSAATNVLPPPADSTTDAFVTNQNSVILNGIVVSNSVGYPVTVTFEYGTSPALGNSVNAVPDTVNEVQSVPVSATLNGLSYDSTYYFRVVATNIEDTTFGNIVSLVDSIPLPIDTTYPADNVTASSAQVNGIVYGNIDTAVVTFEYGTNLFLDNKIVATPGTVDSIQRVSVVISGLTVNTNYYYRIKAVNGAGVSLGGIDSFFTSDLYAIDTTLPATNITAASATLNGTVNAIGSDFNVSFEYGITPSLGDSITAIPGIIYENNAQNVSATVIGLVSDTQYYFRVKVIDSQNVYYGDIISFYTTPHIPLDTTYIATAITSFTAQFNGIVNANGDTTVVTFEYGTSPSTLVNTVNAIFDTINGYNWQNESAAITGLNNDAEYYFRIKAATSSGTTYGDIQQFYTGDPDIPNWDFELWDTITCPVPLGWNGIGGIARVPYNNGWAAKLFAGGLVNAGALVLGGYIGDGIAGGVPFAALPDSIVGYFNYNIAAGDTAFDGIILKKNGNIIYSELNPITGSSNGNFVRLSFPVTVPGDVMPDTLILLIANSNIEGYYKPAANPNSILTVANLSFIGNTPVIPALDFTNWDTLSSVYPAHWPGPEILCLGRDDIVERTTDSYSGKYALRLNNDLAIYGIGRLETSFNLNYRHISLNGYLKWLPENGDSMQINVQMFKQGQPIGRGVLILTNPISFYQPFTCNISYNDSVTIPDSCDIFIALMNNVKIRGNSVAYVDHLSFDEFNFTGINNDPASLADQLDDNFLNVYPNPTNGALNVEYANINPGPNTISVFDLSGRLIYNNRQVVSQTGKITRELDISDCSPGVYILTVVTGRSSLTKKIVVY